MAEDTNYLVPGSLATVERFMRRYPEISRKLDPIVIQETLIEATAHLETTTSRRLVPFTNITDQIMLKGLDPNEYGDNATSMPISMAGSLGISFANALGADDLVRHFFLEQCAPMYNELWTYDIQSMTIYLTYGNSQPIDVVGGGLIGPESSSGHCWLRLGTFAPEGTRLWCTYSGGYTLGIPPNLIRSCMMQAVLLLVEDGTVVMRDNTTANFQEQIDRIMTPWMRY